MITPELQTYIQQQLGAGIAKDVIKQNLSAKGWNVQDLDDAFFAIENEHVAQATTLLTAVQTPAQTPEQNPVQPTVSTSHKGMWAAIIVVLLLIGAGGAYAAYAYGLFASPAPTTVVTRVATTTAPVATTTESSLPIVDTENASTTTASTTQTANPTEATIQQETVKNMGKASKMSTDLKDIEMGLALYSVNTGSFPKSLLNLIPQYISKPDLVKMINDKIVLYAYSADGKNYHIGVDISFPYTQDFSDFKYDKDFNSKSAGYVNGFDGKDPTFDLTN